MEYIVASPQDWIDNAAHNRARKGIDEICQIYTNYKLDRNEAITAVEKISKWFLLLFLRESCYQHLREHINKMQRQVKTD